jgi:hypothetical protein
MAGLAVGALVLGAGTAVYQGVSAANAKKKDEKAARDLVKPFYQIQKEYYQNRDIAANLAEGGLPDSSKNYLTTEAQRGLGTGIAALENNGSTNPNDIARLADVFSNSINKTAATDAQMKIQNIENFMKYNTELAGQKTIKWSLNEDQPYKSRLKQLNQNIAVDKANINNAINTGVSAVSSYGVSRANANLMKDLFKDKSQPTTKTDGTPMNYANPTYNVAQDNPSAFVAKDAGAFAPQTDINGNVANNIVTPPMSNVAGQQTNTSNNPYGAGNAYWDSTKGQWIKPSKLGYMNDNNENF